MDNNKKIRTRFAPSPTGFMHIGNLRSALFEYLVAKHENGDFILRIEDTDQTRQKEGAVEFIYKTLDLCNLNIDEGPNNPKDCGPYIQSERKDIYLKYAEELVEKGEAYYCFCNEERLQELREEAELMKVTFMYDGKCKNISLEEAKKRVANNEPYVIRQKMPKEGVTSYEDLVYGKISVENKLLEDQILIKSDGFPTYNFANVIDDHLMNITHVVRGNEYLSSTPKYLLLYKSFGWESPVYIHLPHIIREDGHKLSKRNGDASFMDLYNAGYLPEATTDFVFSIVIEELGLIGAGLILALLFFLILRIMIVGVKARNPFNSMMALGVGALMLMQVFVNIGGISGLIPSTGVTFPFLSQGGNSLLVTSVGIAFVLNIAANEKRDNIVQAIEDELSQTQEMQNQDEKIVPLRRSR